MNSREFGESTANQHIDSDGEDVDDNSNNNGRGLPSDTEQSLVSNAGFDDDDNDDDARPPWLPFPVEETQEADGDLNGDQEKSGGGKKFSIVIHVKQQREPIDALIERIVARSAWTNVPWRKVGRFFIFCICLEQETKIIFVFYVFVV